MTLTEKRNIALAKAKRRAGAIVVQWQPTITKPTSNRQKIRFVDWVDEDGDGRIRIISRAALPHFQAMGYALVSAPAAKPASVSPAIETETETEAPRPRARKKISDEQAEI
jgi:hypothetical protein